jgi:CRP-like cAMP-binding protein
MTKVTAEQIETLRLIPYLASLQPVELTRLARATSVRIVARGRTIFEEDGAATGIFVILSGRVKLVRRSRAGREQVLHAEGPGATLAEVPVFDGGGYVASAVAVDAARLLFVPRAALLDLCRRRPAVALGVILILARRLRGFAGLIEDLALRDVTARLARFLLAESGRTGEITKLGTHDDIAARVGTVRELVSRSLSRLAREGVLERRGRQIRVRDDRRLATIAEGDANR